VSLSHGKRILFVLSEDQTQEFATEFDGLRRPGLEFVFEPSPEKALESLAVVRPVLVVVGMTLETMEGLEFLARLMKQHPSFGEKVVVLPSKDDPFPAMIHSRDPATGRSTTEETDFATMATLVDALVGDAARAPAKTLAYVSESPPTRPSSDPEPEIEVEEVELQHVAVPVVSEDAATPIVGTRVSGSDPGDILPGPVASIPADLDAAIPTAGGPLSASAPAAFIRTAGDLSGRARARWPLVAVAGGVVVAAAAVAFVILADGTDDEPSGPAVPASEVAGAEEASGADDANPSHARPVEPVTPTAGETGATGSSARPRADEAGVRPAAGAAGSGVDATQAPEPSQATAGQDPVVGESSDPPGAPVDTARLVTLPLRFSRGRTGFRVTSYGELKAVIEKFHDALASEPGARLEVGGHASHEASDDFGRTLGRHRAVKVRDYLIRRGFAEERMVIRSYGVEIPLVSGEGNAARNRRVTLRLID
jgi:outer membrane protein OmpA-like peptidoglycan-associated protein